MRSIKISTQISIPYMTWKINNTNDNITRRKIITKTKIKLSNKIKTIKWINELINMIKF